MPRKFKIGDRVRVVDDKQTSRLKIGEEYTVLDLTGSEIHPKVSIKDGAGGWYEWRFELVGAAAPPEKNPPKVGDVFICTDDLVKIDAKYDIRFVITKIVGDYYYAMPEDGHDENFHQDCSFRRKYIKKIIPPELGKNGKPKKKKKKAIPKKSVRAELLKQVKAGKTTGICAWATEYHTRRIDVTRYSPCHASMGFHGGSPKKVIGVAYSVNHELKGYTKDMIAEYKPYLQYMLKESPWSPAFKTKSASIGLRYEVLMDVSVQRHALVAAMVALREGTEFPNKIPVFNFLKKKGFSGHVCYLLSYAFFMEEGEFKRSGMGGGHQALSGMMNFHHLISFFKNGYSLLPKDGKPYAEEQRRYRIHEYIAPEGDGTLREWCVANFLSKNVGKGFAAKSVIDEESFLAGATKLEQLLKDKQ